MNLPGVSTRQFLVRSVSGANEIQTQIHHAESEQALIAQLDQTGESYLSIEAVGTTVRRKTSRFSVLIFCQQLLSLLEAGLQLVEAMVALTEKEQEPQHRHVLMEILVDLRAGLSFSTALQRQPQVFPVMLQAAVQASEKTGGTQEALLRFVNYESKFQALKSKLKGALIYPAMLLSMGGLVSLFLLGYVVPRFGSVFADRISEMPYLSGAVIRLGLVISDHPWMVLGAFSLLALAGVAVATNAPARAYLIFQFQRMPWLGEILKTIELIRIYRTMAMLLNGGVPAVQSLTMTLGVVSSATRSGIAQAIELVKEGQPLSYALKEHGLITAVSERLLMAGEQSGQMAEMMNRAADFLDFELEQVLDRFVKLLEPVLMVVIGGVIGVIIILMYLPIFELADSIQ